ncbi:hypothetical protein MTO98_27700 [Mucilaginibacter sp. SMC90]|uniref:hypothetical protein n=1 Tax=Mucilaginibacter sp. SMC90 TaxID=2929803 RepID=UPI001FB1F524|nr:hypothetical protein [Mucilaginibacter sp. SMC90]UOE48203.1 hypothetical protein MTO98_27700 [Mucilaginibacter sp. SMC90]
MKTTNYSLIPFVGVMCFFVLSCKKGSYATQDPKPTGTLLISLTSSDNLIEANLYNEPANDKFVGSDFLGFSYEKVSLTDTSLFNKNNVTLINLYKNLGVGSIRIGGNTVDYTYWSNSLRKSNNIKDSVFKSDIVRFAAFDKLVSWKTIWGINLGKANVQAMGDETTAVSDNLQDLVGSFALGNEPDFYYRNKYRTPNYDQFSYSKDFKTYSDSIKSVLPKAIFSGPETVGSVYQTQFFNDFSSNISLLSGHYYRMGPAGDTSITIKKLFTPDKDLISMVKGSLTLANTVNMPYRLTETNSVFNGGQRGISDAHASAVWGVDFLCLMAKMGVAGVNFHTGNGAVYVYTPISQKDNAYFAEPLYYAMLFFHEASIKRFLKCDVTKGSDKLSIFSFERTDGRIGFVFVNKDDKADVSFLLKQDNLIKSISSYTLNGDTFASKTTTNINNSFVSANGNFVTEPLVTDLIADDSKNEATTVLVKAHSALLIVLN